MSRKTATVDSFSLKPLLMLRSILTRWSVVQRDFLKPACPGQVNSWFRQTNLGGA
jgi:hypothetical protein